MNKSKKVAINTVAKKQITKKKWGLLANPICFKAIMGMRCKIKKPKIWR